MGSFGDNLIESFKGMYEDLAVVGPKVIIGLMVLLLTWFISKYVVNLLQRALEPRLDDKLVLRFILKLMRIVILGFAILAFLNIVGLGKIAAGLWGTAGIGAFIIGFAFKDIGEHFLAGFILAFNRPFGVGDTVEMSGYMGTVEGLNLRNTHIKTFDGKDVYIPNGNVIKNPLVNYTIDGFIRKDFPVSIKFDADQDHAISEIKKILSDQKGVLQGRKSPNVVIGGIDKGRIDLKILYWLDTEDNSIGSSEVERSLVKNVIAKLRDMDIHDPYTVPLIKS